MKGEYEHSQMADTIVVRMFPELKEDLKLLVNRQKGRFQNVSHAARAAIVYALNQKQFLDYDGWYDNDKR